MKKPPPPLPTTPNPGGPMPKMIIGMTIPDFVICLTFMILMIVIILMIAFNVECKLSD